MRRIALILVSIAAAGGTVAAVAGADDTHTYEIEMYNAFGIVSGSEVRVAGVNVGVVTDLTVNEKKRALVTIEIEGELTRLGDETICESSPQSLIAEYFLDCDPAGEPLPEGGLIPASQVRQTVQPDLVANTMREPFRERFALLINEFGTALAGNPEALQEAILLGSPALTELEQATRILANHAEMIRAFNVHSEKVSGELADYRDRIVAFVDEVEDVASIALERREDVSRGFDRFDDYLYELRPTLARLDAAARQQRPLLANLREAAPELYRLSIALPVFQRASEDSLGSLSDAAVTGRRALREGRDEIDLLAEAGELAPVTTEIIADFLRDIDDPRRAAEINDQAAAVTGRTGERPGTRNTMGYTGMEGIFNYAYQQSLATNQFDEVGHALHVNLYEYQTGPCGSFSTGRHVANGSPGIPAEEGGRTTDFNEIARCATWLGPNQPGINQDLGLPPYDPSVCAAGTTPAHAAQNLCNSGEARVTRVRRSGPAAGGPAPAAGQTGAPPSSAGPTGTRGPVPSGEGTEDALDPELDDLLQLPSDVLDGLGLGELAPGDRGLGLGQGRGGNRGSQDYEGLLDFLLLP